MIGRRVYTFGFDVNAAPAVVPTFDRVLYVPPEMEERAFGLGDARLTIRTDRTLGPDEWYLVTPKP